MGDDGSGGGSFLLRAIRSTRVKACAMVTASKENADLLCRAFDDSVRAPARSAANGVVYPTICTLVTDQQDPV